MITGNLTPKDWVLITPSDTVPLDRCIGIRADGAGTLVVTGRSGTLLTFNVAAGEVIPGEFRLVHTSSTATPLHAAVL